MYRAQQGRNHSPTFSAFKTRKTNMKNLNLKQAQALALAAAVLIKSGGANWNQELKISV